MPDLGESSSGKAELGDDESNLGYRSDERSSKLVIEISTPTLLTVRNIGEFYLREAEFYPFYA